MDIYIFNMEILLRLVTLPLKLNVRMLIAYMLSHSQRL